MKQIFGIAIFVIVFPFSVLAETSVEGLLDKVDRLSVFATSVIQ